MIHALRRYLDGRALRRAMRKSRACIKDIDKARGRKLARVIRRLP